VTAAASAAEQELKDMSRFMKIPHDYKYKSRGAIASIEVAPSTALFADDAVFVHWSHDWRDISLSPSDAISFANDLLKAAQAADEKFAATDGAVFSSEKTEVQILRDALKKLSQVDNNTRFDRCGTAVQALLDADKAAAREKLPVPVVVPSKDAQHVDQKYRDILRKHNYL
jgi:hypothetical protein